MQFSAHNIFFKKLFRTHRLLQTVSMIILLKNTSKFITILSLGILINILPKICAQVHVIGWQTFENATLGDNNSGINDTSPDTNSTYDATPNGSISGSLYLTGSIGANASNLGYDGMGQDARNEFLNGTTFGNDLLITDYTLADGSPGQRIGPYLNPPPNGEENDGTSSWKFSQTNGVLQLSGDFSITNHSDYHFRLEYVHFDARGMVNTTYSPRTLTLKYLATPGELINASTGTEVSDQRVFTRTHGRPQVWSTFHKASQQWSIPQSGFHPVEKPASALCGRMPPAMAMLKSIIWHFPAPFSMPITAIRQ